MGFNRPISRFRPHAENTHAQASERGLTIGEIDMVRTVFKDSIAYAKVKVHRKGYFPFRLQGDGMAVTPNGEVYFVPSDYRPDFSVGTDFQKSWFMHEITHVWQYQLGYPVRLRGAIRFGLDYSYELDAIKKLRHYNMEAQGDILADYFAVAMLNNPKAVRNKSKEGKIYLQQAYESTLSDFLLNPSDKRNLPGG